jgi:hypothetical protein
MRGFDRHQEGDRNACNAITNREIDNESQSQGSLIVESRTPSESRSLEGVSLADLREAVLEGRTRRSWSLSRRGVVRMDIGRVMR